MDLVFVRNVTQSLCTTKRVGPDQCPPETPIFIAGFLKELPLLVPLVYTIVIGILSFSGFFSIQDVLRFRPPTFLYHGSRDPVVPQTFFPSNTKELEENHLELTTFRHGG